MHKVNGSPQVIKYLKAGQLAIQKSIGRDKTESLKTLDKTVFRSKLSSNGLPVIIPSRDRKLIKGGAGPVIRFWLTLFSLYRVIDTLGELKIQTIFAEQSSKPEVLSNVASQFYSFLKESSMKSMFNKSLMFKVAHILFLETASSTKTVA